MDQIRRFGDEIRQTTSGKRAACCAVTLPVSNARQYLYYVPNAKRILASFTLPSQ